jgi:hypothetical protein
VAPYKRHYRVDLKRNVGFDKGSAGRRAAYDKSAEPSVALKLRKLSVEEGAVFNAEVAAAIQEELAASNYGTLLAGRRITPWLSMRTVTSSSTALTGPRSR